MKLNKLLPIGSIAGLTAIVTPLVTSCSGTIPLSLMSLYPSAECVSLKSKPFKIAENKNYKFSVDMSKSEILPSKLTYLSFATNEAVFSSHGFYGDIKPKTFSISIDGLKFKEVSRDEISEVDKSFCLEVMHVAPEQDLCIICLHYDDVKKCSVAKFTASFEKNMDIAYAI